jgi:PAS domain S-box-containing protein
MAAATLRRMDRVWQSAPAPALWMVEGASGLQVHANDAAAGWAAGQGLDAADWQVLALRWWPASAPAAGPDSVGPGALALRVQRLALDGGAVLLWLQPGAADISPGAAQRATEFLDRALVLAGISVWRLDTRTQRIHFNAVGFHIVGMDPDPAGIPLDTMRATIHPDDRAAVVAAADEAMAGDRVVDVVARYRNRDGSWRTLLTRRVADRDSDGHTIGLAGVSLDLSSQLADRQRVETLTEHTRLAAAAMGVGFWSRDLDAGTGHWDEQMYRIHRRAPALGPPGFDDWIAHHVHPHDQAWIVDMHRRASQRWEPVVDATFRLPDGDGGERWVQSWTRRMVRDGKRLAFGMHLDVTARERAVSQQRRERDRTQFAIEAAEVGVWERDLDGNARYWNETMYRQRGLDPADPRPIETLARQCVHPEDLLLLNRLAQRHMVDGTTYRFEFRVLWPDGSTRWLVTHGRALRDAEGRLLGMAGINLDITERKQADTLRQQKERAELAARDQSAFLARVSHELRTPMNAMLGFTQLLGDDPTEPPSPRQRDRLARIGEAGARMMALVDDLLELVTLEADPLAPAAEDLPVAALVQAALDGWRAQAQQQATALRCTALPGRVLADRRRIAQLLSHLVGHALRHQAQGGWVEVGSRVEGPAETPQLVLTVRDGGPGYTDAERATLFELFQRHGAAPHAGEGTGITLALAWRLARALGGQLDVPAQSGQVGELCLRLPAAAAALPQTAAGPALHVLCVEDNPVNLLLVRELLALRPGVRLREAADGATGIALALAEPPDLLLLDLQLPDIDGLEVLRQLRAEPAMAACVCVALSANAMPDHIAQARAAGFDDYWTKPIDFPQFLAGIDRLASQRG